MTIRHFIFTITTACALSSASLADDYSLEDDEASTTAQTGVITIGVGSQASYNQSIHRPYKGMNRQDVYSHFGEPTKQTPAIGKPPISSWVFNDFTVYFEYDHVIHTVLHDNKSKPLQ